MTDTQSRSDPIEDLHSTSVGHYYEFACDYHKNRDFGNAVSFCERQLAADPHHFPAALLLGELYVENRNLELAVKYAKIAYEIDPSSKVREMLVAALARLSFQHAQEGSAEKLVADLEILLSLSAAEESKSLYQFLKEQYRADKLITHAVVNLLFKLKQTDLLQDWGTVEPRILLVLPPRTLAQEKIARFIKSIEQNIGLYELEIALRADDVLSEALTNYTVMSFNPDAMQFYSDIVFVDGPGECGDSELAARSRRSVYRFDQTDFRFEARLMPLSSPVSDARCALAPSHIFNQGTETLRGDYYYFPYGYLFRYLGFGPINLFGHRIIGNLRDYKNRPANHKLIACFGGSSCFSMYCLHDEMFSTRLELRLRLSSLSTDDKLTFTVLNFGQHGNVVINQFMTYLLFVQDLKPDVVISHDGFNDLGYGQISDHRLLGDYNITYQQNLEDWGSILRGTTLNRPAGWEREGIRQVQSAPDDVVSAYLERGRQFSRVVDSDGAKFVWGLQPYLLSKRNLSMNEQEFRREAWHQKSPYLECYRNMSFLYDLAVKHMEKMPSIDFLNLHQEFSVLSNKDTHFFDIVHLSPAGDDVISSIYANHLINYFARQRYE